MDIEELKAVAMSRRSMLKRSAITTLLLTQAALLEELASPVVRPAAAATTFPDIQFDLGAFVRPAQVFNDGAGSVQAQFGVTYALFLPAKLNRTPTKADQAVLANALNTIEASYPASPSGLLIGSVSYGVPYFNRLPQALVSANMPQTVAFQTGMGTLPAGRPVLVEATPMPTDVVGGFVGGPNATISGVTKDRYNVNVVIENNDVLFQFRSDSTTNLAAVPLWLMGSNNLNGVGVPSPNFNGLFNFQQTRLQFVQPGLPRTMANQYGFDFAPRINPNSSMTMGFVDQQVNGSGPPAICTFAGNSSAKLTNAQPGSYFDNGSIAHFSHVIEDLFQFYAQPNQDPNRPDGEPFTERCQYMFRSNQLGTTNGIPAAGNTDQFTNGGGPAFINNVFQGTGSAAAAARDSGGLFAPGQNQTINATFTGQGRIGHIDGLQRASRAPDGTPLHIRNDGPGLDGMDVPAFRSYPTNLGVNYQAGSAMFKLQFLMFVPTADLFTAMRTGAAAQDLQHQFLNNEDDDNGLERFITATRRQNFLVPPRRHRAFPLLELT
jgi:hypothetical protein